MQRTHLLLSLLIATVRPGHFAEASVMCFNMVEAAGLEPTMPKAGDLQSPGVTNFPIPPIKQEYTLQAMLVAGS